MKQNAQQIRNKLMIVIMAGVAAVGFAAAARAAQVGAGVSTDDGASAQVEAPSNARAGGSGNAHMSTSGSANSNAQWQSGATRGADRAAELGAAGMEATKAKPKRSGIR
jgi:hypothetical protein